jgi:hypothetical protein
MVSNQPLVTINVALGTTIDRFFLITSLPNFLIVTTAKPIRLVARILFLLTDIFLSIYNDSVILFNISVTGILCQTNVEKFLTFI